MSLIRLVYASESQLAGTDRRSQMDRLLASARRLNEQNGISGFLLATDTAFAQILEGSEASVAAIIPPNEWPEAVWQELVRQGKLRYIGHGFYELAKT